MLVIYLDAQISQKPKPMLKLTSFITIAFLLSSIHSFCADNDSKSLELSSDVTISGIFQTSVISYSLALSQTKNVLIAANGRYFPRNVNGIAIVYIRVDGIGSYSNSSIIEWNTSQNAVQHTLDCIAFVTLGAGTHTIELIAYNHASTPAASFVTGANSGISIVTNPAPFFQNSTLNADSQIIDFSTYGIGGRGNLPAATLLTNFINSPIQTNAVTLLSGRAYCAGTQGDALWGIYLNDQCPSNNTSNWGVNDIFSGAELHTPIYCFAMHNLIGNNAISFKATELSYDAGSRADLVQYRVGQDVRVISLWGMGLSGSAIRSNEICYRTDYQCVGSSSGWSGCNLAGANTVIAETTITIPNDHNGVVFFKAATRVQGDPSDNGGSVKIWINIDGIDVGTVGVQQLNAPNCVSARMIAASYVSSGNSKLAPGQHLVKVCASAQGNFIHLGVMNELPLLYFD
jgi:hypothetical protein